MELIGKSVGNKSTIINLSLDEVDIIRMALQTEIYQRNKLGCNATKIEQLLEQVKKELKKIQED